MIENEFFSLIYNYSCDNKNFVNQPS